MEVLSFCNYLGFLFVSYCVLRDENSAKQKRNPNEFEVTMEWNYINFTWPSPLDYVTAIATKRYIPENNVMSGMKFYKGDVYIALPKLRDGSPVTLAVVENARRLTTDALLRPFPSWEMNQEGNCGALQSVHGMEIDRSGIMWVLDGNRVTNSTICPAKLVLLDLKNGGKVLHYYQFPEELSSRSGGFLNDLVVDENDGYAYITENSDHDPGIIVYSRYNNRAWKLRDRSMFAEIGASVFTVAGLQNTKLTPVDGIAMSPLPKYKNQERLVYYCALSGLNLFAVSNKILQNERLGRSDGWRRHVRHVGVKQGQSDGLVIDNEGNFYYGLLNLYGVGKWNVYENFINARVVDQNREIFVWPDTFGFDSNGFLYVLTNGIHKYFSATYPLTIDDGIKFRILRLFTGTRSYLYN